MPISSTAAAKKIASIGRVRSPNNSAVDLMPISGRPRGPGAHRWCRNRYPGDRAGVEHEGRRIKPAEDSRPAHQRAPGEGEAEHDLRPIGDAFHERIDGDDCSEAMPVATANG